MFAAILCLALASAASAMDIEHLGRDATGSFAGAVLGNTTTSFCFRDAKGELVVSPVLPSGAEWLAKARFKDEIEATGWSYLALEGSADAPNQTDVAFAAGYLESALTWSRVLSFAQNTGVNGTLGKPLEDWLASNDAYTAAQISAHADSNSTWYQLKLLHAQYEGVIAGYAAAAPASAKLMRVAFRNMQIGGDLESLSSAVTALSHRNLTAAELIPSDGMRRWLGLRVDARGAVADGPGAHCSALVKLLEDDVVIAQATWGSLEGMTRVYKRYDLPFFTVPGSSDRVPATSTWFSSYPATLFSGDDWYMTSAGEGMVVLETTIGNSNPDLWKYVQPQCILEWARNVIANRLGSSGQVWAETFSQENSGTYNNEFIVMDNSRIELGRKVQLHDGAITMLDQLPGYIEFHDVTDRLRTESYIPSYNVPAFHDVWVMSGLEPMEREYGPWFSYNGTARGLMFRRNQSTITSVDGVRALMRYNNFKHDPISRQGQEGRIPPYTAENAIACRDDLNPADGNYSISAFGFRDHVETDCKLTSAKLMRGQAVRSETAGAMIGGASSFTSVIISGPTHQGAMPPFQYSTSAFKTPPSHAGLPDVFAFNWTVTAL